VTERAPGRYELHDLLRIYAAELACGHDPDADRQAAAHRMLDSYLGTAVRAAWLLNRHRVPITPTAAEAGVTVEPITTAKQAITWFTTEHAALIAAIALARRDGFDHHAWQLAWALVDYLDRRGHWLDWVTTQRAALTSARRADDQAGQAHCHRGLGRALARTGRYRPAYRHLHRALELFAGAGDLASRARTHLDLSWLLGLRGRDHDALDHAQQALDLYLTTGDQDGQARALNAVGWDYARIGHYQHALDCCRRALALHRRIGDRAGEAATWDSLGLINLRLGRFRRAATSYEHALARYRDLGDRLNSAAVLDNIGDVHSAASDRDAANVAWLQAADILAELGDPRADHVRAKVLTPASADRGR
jgi:tetratricopeptide (TPR) repeat protein